MIEDLPSKVRSRIFSELSACHAAAANVPSFLGRDRQETVEVLGEELYNLSDDVSDDFYQDAACHSTGNILNYKEASIYLEVSKHNLNYFIFCQNIP